MARINMTNLTNGNTTAELYGNINAMTGQALGLAICISLWFILMISFRKYGFQTAFSSASYITTVIALIMRSFNLIGDLVFFCFLVLSAISIAVTLMQDN